MRTGTSETQHMMRYTKTQTIKLKTTTNNYIGLTSFHTSYGDLQGGPKKWCRTYSVLHCTCGITFFGPPGMYSAEGVDEIYRY